MGEAVQDLKSLCDGYAETRVVAIEKYNNHPGYVPLAKLSEERMLIGQKRDDTIAAMQQTIDRLSREREELVDAGKRLEREHLVALAERDGHKKSLEVAAQLHKLDRQTLESLMQSNVLYEHDIAKIRVAVGELKMHEILGPQKRLGEGCTLRDYEEKCCRTPLNEQFLEGVRRAKEDKQRQWMEGDRFLAQEHIAARANQCGKSTALDKILR